MAEWGGSRSRARTVAGSTFESNYDDHQYNIRQQAWSPTASNGPEVPPRRPPSSKHGVLSKASSLSGYGNDQNAVDDEELYISTNDIDSFPTRPAPRPIRNRPATMNETTRNRARHQPRNNTENVQNVYSPLPTGPVPPTQQTLQADFYTAVNKPNTRQGALPPRPQSPRPSEISSPAYSPDIMTDNRGLDFGSRSPGEGRSPNASPVLFTNHQQLTETVSNMTTDTAIYGMAHGGTPNLTMNLKKIQSKLLRLYQKIEESADSAQVYELKMHLKLPEHASTSAIHKEIHKSLMPPSTVREQAEQEQETSIFVVDFVDFGDKFKLRQQLINMFAEPGPPSVSYQKVDAKMDATITEFCQRTEDLKLHRNEMIQSPAHARMIMKGISDAEGLVKTLRDNELWIRWGTASFLPPLAHLYMHKHPPYYEVRKAVTISCVAERRNCTPDMFRTVSDPQSLCPPIYGRVRSGNSSDIRWQVTEYNETTGKFESRECQLPSWLTKEAAAWNVLHSSNRSQFDKGNHPYSLYSVYLVIIKDFTLEQDSDARGTEKDSWSTPCKYQYYVDSSSTGVLYRFTHVKNSHCERVYKVLQEAPSLRHFRCYEGCDLIEACLALSWLRRQPRAVFVLNSFLAPSMSSLSLERKKPFHDRMLTLQNHLAEGRKLGPLFDMRYGMCGTTTITEDLE